MNESRLATTHVSVANRETGMPSMAARSDRSAVARIAVPTPSAVEEERDRRHRQRGGDQGEEVVGAEHERADRDRRVERCRDPLRRRALTPQPRHQQRPDGEQLRDPDGRDGEHQPRRVPEAAHERELDDRTEHDRSEQADDEADPPRPAPEHDEADRRARRGGIRDRPARSSRSGSLGTRVRVRSRAARSASRSRRRGSTRRPGPGRRSAGRSPARPLVPIVRRVRSSWPPTTRASRSPIEGRT